MTVGIGAICRGDDGQKVVMAADRMVTVGQGSGIEYEDTESKLEVITGDDGGPLVCVAVGSGSLSIIDETLRRLEDKLIENPPSSVRELVQQTRDSFQAMERDTINQNVLSAFDIELTDLTNEGTDVPPNLEEAIVNDIASIREQLQNNFNLLVGGIDESGAELYTVGRSCTSYTSTGYAVVGSGSSSAELDFIRNRYDPDDASLTEALFSVGEAKVHAEERQGVGQEMDMAVINDDGVAQIEDIEELRDELKRVEDNQRQERERIMEEWEE